MQDLGTITVATNPTITMILPATSQFYSKLLAHEQVHVAQWGPTGLLGSNYSASGFFDAVKNLTDSSQAGLVGQINTVGQNYVDAGDARVAALCNQSELAAYTAVDSMAPQYLYQTCNRTTFPNCH